MSELRLTIGLPGSGKSQYAIELLTRESHWRRINWDNERKLRGMQIGHFNRTQEQAMQTELYLLAEVYGKEGLNVIVDNTNLNEGTRNKWKGVAQRAGMIYTEVEMDVSIEECVERDSRRTGSEQVGRAVIERMALFGNLIKFGPSEKLVLVDMDGTLADCSHRRHFISEGRHDWASFEGNAILQDPPRDAIINLTKILHSQGYVILIVSGRSIDRAGKHTVNWLKNNGLSYTYRHIFMRRGGDHREDYIVKKEILDKLPKNQIVYVLDDRAQVVRMWRENGLTCLQVADGDF